MSARKHRLGSAVANRNKQQTTSDAETSNMAGMTTQAGEDTGIEGVG